MSKSKHYPRFWFSTAISPPLIHLIILLGPNDLLVKIPIDPDDLDLYIEQLKKIKRHEKGEFTVKKEIK